MSVVERELRGVLEAHLNPILARSVLSCGLRRISLRDGKLREGEGARLIAELELGVRLYLQDESARRKCIERLTEVVGVVDAQRPPGTSIVPVETESDVVVARSAAREMARAIGFSSVDQVKLATAVSELARNIVQYAGSGEVRLHVVVDGARRSLVVEASDTGPGIADLDHVLSPAYRSRRGMGVGLRGTRRLVDEMHIDTAPGRGTRVRFRKQVT